MTGRRRMVTRLTEWIDVASVSPASQHAGADLIFRLHSWYATGTIVPHVEVPDGSDAVSRRSWEAAAAARFTRIRTGNWPPGVLGLAAVERGIPVLEAEIGGQGMSTAENRCAYVEHLTRLLRHLGIMDGVAEPGPHIEILGRGLVHAPAGGMPRLNVRLGDYVEAGSISGEDYKSSRRANRGDRRASRRANSGGPPLRFGQSRRRRLALYPRR